MLNKKPINSGTILIVGMLFMLSYGKCFSRNLNDTIIDHPELGRIIIYDDHTWEKADDSLKRFNCDSILLGKYVTNRGLGGEDLLLGARNFRTVLKGVLYRGGANNVFNTCQNRYNNNPMSMQSLIKLSSLGFNNVFYLYGKNFERYYPDEVQNSLSNAGIHYSSVAPHSDSLAYIILKQIHYNINHPEAGPLYLHCWNGWHMSGIMSAFALMQFCDFRNQSALQYWIKGTDGNDKGFDKIKKRILSFKKYPELDISPSQKLKICPCTK